MMLITTTAACVLAIYPVVKCAMRRRLLIDEDGVALIVVALIAVGDDGFAANRASTNAVTIVEDSDVQRKSPLAPWRLLWVGLGMDRQVEDGGHINDSSIKVPVGYRPYP